MRKVTFTAASDANGCASASTGTDGVQLAPANRTLVVPSAAEGSRPAHSSPRA